MKGKGLIATRDIQAGEIIITEPIIFAVGLPIAERPLHTAGWLEGTYSQAIGFLSPASRSAFEALNGSGSLYRPLPHLAKLMSNNWVADFYLKSPNVKGGYALYDIISRANHSCAPNASFSRSPSIIDGKIHAVRLIPAGAEITVSYTVLTASRSDRRKLLAAQFNFDVRPPKG